MEQPKNKWWVSILAGVGIAFLSYCAFVYFTRAEQGLRDGETMPLFFVLTYQLLGRWGVLILGGLTGLASIIAGIKDFLAAIRARKVEAVAGESAEEPLVFKVTTEQLNLGATQFVDVQGVGIVKVKLTSMMQHGNIIRLPKAGPLQQDVFLQIDVVG